jgi:hypothetical protein
MLLILSCSKDKDNNSDDNVLIISPEILVSYGGKDWNSISKGLENKKGYWYSTLNNGNILAAISLPAKDPNAPALNYKVIFNITQQNRVTDIHVDCTDTLNITTKNQLFLYYYDHAFNPMTGVVATSASFNDPTQPPPTVNQLLTKVRTLNCQNAFLLYVNDRIAISAGFFSPGGFAFGLQAP